MTTEKIRISPSGPVAPAPEIPNWQAVLEAGAESGPFDPIISEGASIRGEEDLDLVSPTKVRIVSPKLDVSTIDGVTALELMLGAQTAARFGAAADFTVASLGQVLKKLSATSLGFGDVAVNYSIGSRAQLAELFPPVGGVFTLPTGVYAITGGITLLAGERIVTAAASVISICGAGDGAAQSLIGDIAGAPVFAPASVCFVMNLRVQNLAIGEAIHLPVGAQNLKLIAVRTQSLGVGLRISSASASAFSSMLCRFQGTTCAVLCDGGTDLRSLGDNFDGSAGPGLRLNATMRLVSFQSTFNSGLNLSPCIDVLAAGRGIQMHSGNVQSYAASKGPGILLSGAVGNSFLLEGVEFFDASVALRWAAGAIGPTKIIGCFFSSLATQGIDWAAANVPAQGLIELGNTFSMSAANAFVNHTASSARVMRRSNMLNAGVAAAETAIVP